MTGHHSRLSRIAARAARARTFYTLLAPLWAFAACDYLAHVRVSVANGATTTSENGEGIDVVVQPQARPNTPLEIFAESSNSSEAVVTGVLRFDASNWQTAQSLRVTGVDDERADGDQAYVIEVFAREAGAREDRRWLLERIELLNRDDDSSRFEPIAGLAGGDSFMRAVAASADGSVVIGQSADGARPLRWSDGHTIAVGAPGESANAVSADGSQMVGAIDDARYEQGRAAAAFFVDRAAEELADPPQPGPGGGLLLWFVSATAALDDGTVYGSCLQYQAYGEPLGCRQREDGALELIGGSLLYAADDYGHYAGTQHAERHAPFSSRPFLNGVTLAWPDDIACPANVACTGEVRGYSDQAALSVGSATVPLSGTELGQPLYDRAFTYSASSGLTWLPDLEGGELASAAYAVSADGRVVVGYGYDERGQQAVIWLDGHPRALFDVLLEVGTELPDGWSLRELRAVSRDARIVVGNGINARGDAQAFRVTVPYLP